MIESNLVDFFFKGKELRVIRREIWGLIHRREGLTLGLYLLLGKKKKITGPFL